MTLPVLQKLRNDAVDIFSAGLQAVDPLSALRRCVGLRHGHLSIGDHTFDLSAFKHIYIIGAGKASGPMAAAMEDILGNRITQGLVVVKYGHTATLSHVSQIEAGHPIPDKKGQQGANAIQNLAGRAGSDDLVICLMSGGGSALMPAPSLGLTLTDKQKTIEALLACGADIHEINTIRKHLSQIKGGWLAVSTHPARMVSLILSDVVGDDLDISASGPTVPDPSTYEDCLNLIEKYNLSDKLPERVCTHIARGARGAFEETPKPGHPSFEKTDHFIVANNFQALAAAKAHAESRGYHTIVLTSLLTGETRDAAYFHAAIIKEIIQSGHPIKRPACLLSGGETTVTLKGKGKGGRNQEFALALVEALKDQAPLVCLSAGTDGTDGPTDAAGAIMDSTTYSRAKEQCLDVSAYLANNDAYRFFEKLGDLLITGPTRTNVMDIHIGLVGP